MISGKDITIDKDGNIILNGDKFPLASQAEIDAVKDDIDDIEEKLEKTFTLDSGTVIPDNSDLNDYKTPGNYYHLTANVGTISNIPINKGFRLTVLLDLKDAGFVEQLFNPIGTYTLYKRYLSSGTTWSDWAVVEDNIGDLTQTGVTGASVAAQIGVLGDKLNFTHFVQIPFSTSILDSIEAAFENGTIPVDLYGITFGIVRGDAGSQRAVFIAQNQSLGASQTRCGAIYFGSYTAPHYCYKQDSAAWVDTAL